MLWSFTVVTCTDEAYQPYLDLWANGILPTLDELGILIYGVWLPEGEGNRVAWLRADFDADDRAAKMQALREHAGWRAVTEQKYQLEGPGTVRTLTEVDGSNAGHWVAERFGGGPNLSYFEMRTFTARPGRRDELVAVLLDRLAETVQWHDVDYLGVWTSNDDPNQVLLLEGYANEAGKRLMLANAGEIPDQDAARNPIQALVAGHESEVWQPAPFSPLGRYIPASASLAGR